MNAGSIKWVDEGWSKFVDQRNQAKLAPLEDRGHIKAQKQNNVINRRHYRTKGWGYMKGKINEHETVRIGIRENCVGALTHSEGTPVSK
jgi:hypothetical protein